MRLRRPRRIPALAELVSASVAAFQILLGAADSRAAEEWVPAEPDAAGWDWARIDTDEWIKGELIVLQQDVMVFESDKFDELKIDWEDVKDLRLDRPRDFRCTENRFYSGTGELRDGVLKVRQKDGTIVEIPHDEVVSITYTDESRLKRWSVKIGANLAARSGNTDQQDFGANALIRRDGTYTRWENRYNGAIGKVDGEDTTNNHRASSLLDLLVTNRFFVRLPSFEFYSDEFQNIDERYTAGAGVGYEPIDDHLTDLRFSIGAAGQRTENTGGSGSTDAAVLFNTDLSFDFPRDIDLDLKYALQLIVTDFGRTSHSTSAVLSFEVWDPIELDIGAYWDRIEEPESTGNGATQETPKHNDIRLTVGLSVDF